MQLLRQPNQSPMALWEQVVTLICATGRMFAEIPSKEVKTAQKKLLNYFAHQNGKLCMKIQHGETYSPEIRDEIIAAAENFFKTSTYQYLK